MIDIKEKWKKTMDEKKIKIVALCGKAGAGKDFCLHQLMTCYPEWNEIISCTTRPPREGEKEGVNYYFLSSDEFRERLFNGDMLEATVFRGWSYGTAFSALNENTINLGVFNPAGVERLLDYPELDVCIIEITADDKTRLLRQLNREQNPDVHEIVRRFSTDEEDFNDFHKAVVDNRYTIMNNTKDKITAVVNNLILCIQEHFKEA